MPLRKIAFALIGLGALPAAASAGPIEFTLGANLTSATPLPAADSGLYALNPSGRLYAFPAFMLPAEIAVADYNPRLIPPPPAADVKPNATVFWDVYERFVLTLTLGDPAGHSVTFQLDGAVNLDNYYLPGDTGWYGIPTWRFQSYDRFTLDGQTYTVWGANLDSGARATVDVYVGSGAPPMPQWTPEPGTFALVAIGLVPLGLRARRRVW